MPVQKNFVPRYPLGKNRVLDYLVNINHDDGRFDIVYNPKLKFPTISKHKIYLILLLVKAMIKQMNEQLRK